MKKMEVSGKLIAIVGIVLFLVGLGIEWYGNWVYYAGAAQQNILQSLFGGLAGFVGGLCAIIGFIGIIVGGTIWANENYG